ncbi:hypothetical protein CC2G_004198 [Coprinopsis cinerea AmutBmut pab1-1]|nr:hypothetical protein CC2G_004198 [Coprinopsis cinerea AmutBmut pab1-1]
MEHNENPQLNLQPNPNSRKAKSKQVQRRLAEAALQSHGQDLLPVCVCGRDFNTKSAYTNHLARCAEYASLRSRAMEESRARRSEEERELENFPQAHTSKKARRELTNPAPIWYDSNNLDVDYGSDDLHLIESAFDGSDADSISATGKDSSPPRPPSPERGRGKRKAKSVLLTRYADYLPSSTVPFTIVNAVVPSSTAAEPLPASRNPVSDPSLSPPPLQIRETLPNDFGLYKRFKTVEDHPHDPDLYVAPSDLHDDESAPIPPLLKEPELDILHPFPNVSSFLLSEWWWKDREGKSKQDFMELISIVGDDKWDAAGVRTANWAKIDRALTSGGMEDSDNSEDSEWVDDDGTTWVTSEVTIDVPLRSKLTNRKTIPYTIKDFTYRPLLSVIKDRLSDAKQGEHFHYLPYELRWKPGEEKENVRVHGELYTSPAFLDEFEKLQQSPKEPGCDLPRYVVGLMFGSDATMLAQFGSAKAWPVYMFYGNDSKYRRCKPSTKLGEHIAFLEKLPDDFKDFYLEASGKERIDPALLTHCERELFHAQWRILLDDEFMEAYQHGIVVVCPDGHKRRFYPRIFTYSADYQEKIVVASIRNLGLCPCPRCLIPLREVHLMGQVNDMKNREKYKRVDDQERQRKVAEAHKRIYVDGVPVTGRRVERLLQKSSLVPARNAFSERLSPYGFDFHQMIVVDILHEVDGGVWKYIFVQLLRLLEAVDSGQVNELDKRYRLVPTFGVDTIRRFRNNISELKQLAARDFEDILQCAIPVFEDLLPPPHNQRIMRMLFSFAHWQALAKLRMHTSHTLSLLDKWTRILGDDVREFDIKTCGEIATKELEREYQARQRREAKAKEKKTTASVKSSATDSNGTAREPNEPRSRQAKASKPEVAVGPSSTTYGRPLAVQTSAHEPPAQRPAPTAKELRRYKTLNLNTSKWHSLGDVGKHIRLFGTTDSYSTQLPELYHKFSKRRYKRTNKKRITLQLARIHMRQARIARIRRRLFPNAVDEGFAEEHLEEGYFIGKSQNRPVSLRSFARGENEGTQDPAYRNFIWKLRKHLYPRVIRTLLQEAVAAHASRPSAKLSQSIEKLTALVEDADQDGVSVDNNTCHVLFQPERIYAHSRFVKNFTTYDLRRGQDVINPKTSRRNVMCLRDRSTIFKDQGNDRDPSRFHYARVLGVYHANIIYNGPGSLDLRSRRFDFLWVRWYDHCRKGQWDSKQMDRLRFTPLTEPDFDTDTIGFLAPEDVLRGCHIIPRFAKGKVYGKGSRSKGASNRVGDHDDWNEYYVNRFVDRDMVMRFHWGLGVGHLYSHGDAPDETQGSDSPSPSPDRTSQVSKQPSPSSGSSESTGLPNRQVSSNDSNIQRKHVTPVPADGYDTVLDVDDYASSEAATEPEFRLDGDSDSALEVEHEADGYDPTLDVDNLSTDSEVAADPEFNLEDREALDWELEQYESGLEDATLDGDDWTGAMSEESDDHGESDVDQELLEVEAF